MKGAMDAGGCFPTGRHYPGIAHLLRVTVEGLSDEWDGSLDIEEIPWVSIDTETTGRNHEEDRVIEVGCVFFKKGEIVDRKGWLMNPGCPIPADASAVHGIFDKDVEDKPAFGELVDEILSCMLGHLPLAYNAEFDRNFLRTELSRTAWSQKSDSDLPPAMRRKVQWIDPLDWARELQKEHRSRSLGDVCQRLGISLENAHRATDDAAAAGLVMARFLDESSVPRPYASFIREQMRLNKTHEFERMRFR